MFKLIPNSFIAFLIYSFCSFLMLILVSNSVYANALETSPTTENMNNLLKQQKFIPIGETTFTVLFWDVYTSKLLTTSGKYPIIKKNDSLLFNINYLKKINSDDLIEKTIEQWQHLGFTKERYQNYLPILKQMWPNINEGDRLSLLIYQGRSIFYFNEQYLGVINEFEFGDMFLAIWLSDETSQPSLRNELLGNASRESE